jgi:hypothetical protein
LPLLWALVSVIVGVDPTSALLYVHIPAYWPSVVNPLVAVLTIRDYREATRLHISCSSSNTLVIHREKKTNFWANFHLNLTHYVYFV